jgi:DNA sulfur modification protein DndB
MESKRRRTGRSRARLRVGVRARQRRLLSKLEENPPSLELIIPALRCSMGSWVYYAAAMRLGDVAARVRLAEAIHESKSINELIQRALDKRASDIGDYLLNQRKERFFNAIVVGVYGGEPEWLDLRVEENPILAPADIPEYVTESLGILRLSGSEQLFALDGQHRVVGIREALGRDAKLSAEQIIALFVAHEKSKSGLERTRRLFTTLNRYAKPVNKRDLIALDEDDIVAIVTRKLVDTYPLFLNKISIKHTKSMPASAVEQFTSIVALYDALDIYLRSKSDSTTREWTRFKRFRKADATIQDYYDAAAQLFEVIGRHFNEVGEMRREPPRSNVAGKYRTRNGGHLLFRPIGLSILVRTVVSLTSEGKTLTTAVRAISRVPMELDADPWLGLLWDPQNQRMIVRSENQNVARKILHYGAGGDLKHLKTTPAKVGKELAGLLNLPHAVQLQRY